MSEWLATEHVLQHVAVSMVALGAAGIVARKVLGVFQKPGPPVSGSGSTHACAHCGSAPQHEKVGRRT